MCEAARDILVPTLWRPTALARRELTSPPNNCLRDGMRIHDSIQMLRCASAAKKQKKARITGDRISKYKAAKPKQNSDSKFETENKKYKR